MDFSRGLADCKVFLWKTLRLIEEGVPQRLKPRSIEGFYGTVEAVPLSKTGLTLRTEGPGLKPHLEDAFSQG
jgi:hypothetical protein